MKKKLFYFIILGLYIINCAVVGQTSKLRTEKINGVEYYIYSVEVSEGLFAIGRKFDVSVDDISTANPSIKGGLKVGQQLLIPKRPKNSFHEPTNKEIAKSQEFILHKVIKKQTLFAICNQYNVSQEEIKKYNPQITNGLTEGIVLKIPKKSKNIEIQKEEKLVDEVKTENTKIHIVQKNETLYSISKKYNTTVLEIIKSNPGTSTNIEIGTALNIPHLEISDVSSTNIVETIKVVDSVSKTEQTKLDKKPIKIAYLLPFMLNEESVDPFIERFIDFYAGSLIAIMEAKEKGISLEIYVFDTEKTESKIIEVLNNPELKTVDLIIGPAYTNQVSQVADFAFQNKINTLIPFTAKVPEIENNPYLFQFNPGAESELLLSKEVFTGKYKHANLVFAEIVGISASDEGRIWTEALKIELARADVAFSTIKLITADDANFSTVLKNNENNILIFNTDKFDFVNPFLNPILEAQKNFNIKLFKQYRWKNQTEQMPKGIYLSAFKSNMNTTPLSNFNNQFTDIFNKEISTDSPRFDLLGYDLSNYFINLISQHSTNITDEIKLFKTPNNIQSEPKFDKKTFNSGFINQQLYLVEEK